MSAVYTLEGISGLLEVFEDKITITPKGVFAFLRPGIRTIPIYSIFAIHLKKSGLMSSGYLQFIVPGGRGQTAPGRDENAIVFLGQNELALEIKEYIEKRIQELRKAQIDTTHPSIVDELQKLADMKRAGILSEEEFQVAKRKLIG